MLIREKLGRVLLDWLEKMPADIQATVEKYPPGAYHVKADAPYSITAPGCLVELLSYPTATEAHVVIVEGTPEAEAAHKAKLSELGLPHEFIEGIHATVAIKHLELIWVHPELGYAWRPENWYKFTIVKAPVENPFP